MSTVNQKGVLGLVKVTADLVSSKYEVFTPISGASPVDLIVTDSQFNMKRVQVKYRETNKEGKSILVSLDSVVNGKRVPVNTKLIDIWAIYCPQTEQIYYVRRSELKGRGISLSVQDFKGRKRPLASEFANAARIWIQGE